MSALGTEPDFTLPTELILATPSTSAKTPAESKAQEQARTWKQQIDRNTKNTAVQLVKQAADTAELSPDA